MEVLSDGRTWGAQTWSEQAALSTRFFFDGGANLKLDPNLAEKWEADAEGKVWTFHLPLYGLSYQTGGETGEEFLVEA